MTIKTQLQQNNIELQAHLQDILALPNVNDVKNGQYVWKELTSEGGDFRKYVVSDNETAYPDGGEKDGFWYERVVDIEFQYSKVSSGTFTTSSDTENFNLVHNLGEIAKMIFVYTDETIPPMIHYIKSLTLDVNLKSFGVAIIDGNGVGSSSKYPISYKINNNNQIKFDEFINTSISVMFKSGVKYSWIAMA